MPTPTGMNVSSAEGDKGDIVRYGATCKHAMLNEHTLEIHDWKR